MKTEINGATAYISGVKDFDLTQTLECGQCFHFIKESENTYLISALSSCIRAAMDGSTLIIEELSNAPGAMISECGPAFCSASVIDADKWIDYFDLKRDYGQIKKKLLSMDKKLQDAIEAMNGTRILNQEFFETLISFIISQNQQIPRIKNIVAAISGLCGKCAGGDKMYIFPDARSILLSGEEGIRSCKAGFRAPYIIDACRKVSDGSIDEKSLRECGYEKALESLKTIKGVGDKVANCVLLFSLGYRSAFPVDVWIKRIMEQLYFNGEDTPIPKIRSLAAERFGEYGGYAQQYLFYYGKENRIGK